MVQSSSCVPVTRPPSTVTSTPTSLPGKEGQFSAGPLEQSMGARNRVGIGLSYGPAMLHRLAGRYDNSVPTRFLTPVDCSKIPAQNFLLY